jgi:hypothetical protein
VLSIIQGSAWTKSMIMNCLLLLLWQNVFRECQLTTKCYSAGTIPFHAECLKGQRYVIYRESLLICFWDHHTCTLVTVIDAIGELRHQPGILILKALKYVVKVVNKVFTFLELQVSIPFIYPKSQSQEERSNWEVWNRVIGVKLSGWIMIYC